MAEVVAPETWKDSGYTAVSWLGSPTHSGFRSLPQPSWELAPQLSFVPGGLGMVAGGTVTQGKRSC